MRGPQLGMPAVHCLSLMQTKRCTVGLGKAIDSIIRSQKGKEYKSLSFRKAYAVPTSTPLHRRRRAKRASSPSVNARPPQARRNAQKDEKFEQHVIEDT